ncbi:proline racemase [Aspergillus californicus]
MDIFSAIRDRQPQAIHCVNMHTTGEPTRIVLSGFPDLQGTLLAQRSHAKTSHDNIRSRIILEPRGHYDMYGAVLRPQTEFVRDGTADIGVLFMHNEGFSTMCGHATIALGRFLVDTHDRGVFPNRDTLPFDPVSKITKVRLHAPCGILDISVPTVPDPRNDSVLASDPSRPVSFLSVPAFATGVNVKVPIPITSRWPELQGRESITVDVSYGGTFYALVSAKELGFPGGLRNVNLGTIGRCAKLLKRHLASASDLKPYLILPGEAEPSPLYSIMITDNELGPVSNTSIGAETGLCYFADNQIDRSPTGGCVVARVALAYAKGQRTLGERWTYHSLLSSAVGEGGFIGSIVKEVHVGPAQIPGVLVRVEGHAYYTGASSFVLEDTDPISGNGFSLNHIKHS